jgi:hypothetical protein
MSQFAPTNYIIQNPHTELGTAFLEATKELSESFAKAVDDMTSPFLHHADELELFKNKSIKDK